ncbi:ribosomal protein L29 [Vulcanisaeta distributa DSM 14429]|uniref:Large ribosomal subunit protein uL29 n=2 Tax=Vulcanisaeta distributa TaxID=164451 RepID=E1QTW9_VULDI|nr:50S ribosomal protein L29 [Vulcanisaeta distributa]ADN49766.1 ribosomal protein L29 [Vulcanisaeta distributa DSM 14429]
MASRQRLNARTIRNMKPEDRAKLLNDLRNELLKLQTQRERGTLDNPGRVRAIRRAIARVLTIMNEEARKAVKAGE